jgi:hypothetical protein
MPAKVNAMLCANASLEQLRAIFLGASIPFALPLTGCNAVMHRDECRADIQNIDQFDRKAMAVIAPL